MSDNSKTYSVEQIIECVNSLPIDTVEIVYYHESSVDIKYGEDIYKITKHIVAIPFHSKPSLNTEARIISMCLETAAKCLFNTD